jgi:Holliday junction DNA helicase RuvA
MVVLDCGGVGYRLGVSRFTMSAAAAGKKLRLYTFLHVREDIFELFGFASLEEKSFFTMLLDISGVGPKAALAILSCATPDKLALGIVNGDEKLLCRAQGVGKKLAQRIILELKDKVLKALGSELPEGPDTGVEPAALLSEARASAVSALMVLGYSGAEARTAVSKVGKEVAATEDIIRLALKMA